ncbi:MAG: hypothetical protein IJS32_07380 [Kiritimatiellae bacterium]|nr:hypothetical protein [Kiritimatiellia bacterium]
MAPPKPVRINSARRAVASRPRKEEVSIAKVLVILAILGGIAFAGWKYRAPLLALLPSNAGNAAQTETAAADGEGSETETAAAPRDPDAVPDDWVSVAPDLPAKGPESPAEAQVAEAAGADGAAEAAAAAQARAERELMPAYNEAGRAFNAALEGYNAVRQDLTQAETREKAEKLAEKAVEGYRALSGRMTTVPVEKNLADAESLLKQLRAIAHNMRLANDFAVPGSARMGRPHAAPARPGMARTPVATRTAAPTASAAATKTAAATRSADQTMVRAPNLD